MIKIVVLLLLKLTSEVLNIFYNIQVAVCPSRCLSPYWNHFPTVPTASLWVRHLIKSGWSKGRDMLLGNLSACRRHGYTWQQYPTLTHSWQQQELTVDSILTDQENQNLMRKKGDENTKSGHGWPFSPRKKGESAMTLMTPSVAMATHPPLGEIQILHSPGPLQSPSVFNLLAPISNHMTVTWWPHPPGSTSPPPPTNL